MGDLMHNKLVLLRDVYVSQINEFLKSDNEKLKKPTSQERLAQVFADLEKPLPISFRAQDFMRLILYYGSILPKQVADIDKNPGDTRLRKDHAINKANRKYCWSNLVEELADHFPGDKKTRKGNIQKILQAVLEEYA